VSQALSLPAVYWMILIPGYRSLGVVVPAVGVCFDLFSNLRLLMIVAIHPSLLVVSDSGVLVLESSIAL
jgi:hypothetical protein